MKSAFDVAVLGQGLAGTAVAWWLRWAGLKVLVVDRETTTSASRVAAGLITPITGRKLVRSWNLARLWPAATNFYRRVEQQTSSNFFHEVAMVRLLKSPDEAALFQSRSESGEYSGLVESGSASIDDRSFVVDHGGFEMDPGGRLDVPEYLRASRDCFRQDEGYRSEAIDVSRDIELSDDLVYLPRPDVTVRWLVFCQGIDAIQNPWFPDVWFKPAKGEILTLRIPDLKEVRVVHRGVWLTQVGNGLFKAGSTYDWEQFDSLPTEEGRKEIISQLQQFLRLPFEVVSHEAAVRPIHRNQYPVLGTHPAHRQLLFFNGLGSKGSLHSPEYARQLVELMLHGTAVDSDVDLNLKARGGTTENLCSPNGAATLSPAFHVKRQAAIPLTEQAQLAIRQGLQPGEIAVDATAGNGHDTQFLAELVGPAGRVFAFDLQPIAIQNTANRLAGRSLQNVILQNASHEQMAALIPAEFHGRIGAVMFNLGYLPGGDKQIKTSDRSTRAAINQAVELLRPGGQITIVSYTGHDGGESESREVVEVLDALPRERFQFEAIESVKGRVSGPRLFVVKRTLGGEKPAPPG